MTHEQERGSALEPPAWEAARLHAKRTIALGAAFVAVGLAISIVTYLMASHNPHGGTYLVAWGPVVFGVFTVVRGLGTLRTANAAATAASSSNAVDDAANGWSAPS
jgi:hypothetical protein